jgi:hypothetical protein
MDQVRRERIREIIRFLESTQNEVDDIWLDEEGAFENRSAPSKETQLGQLSSAAIDSLENAVDQLQLAIANLRDAIGDEST